MRRHERVSGSTRCYNMYLDFRNREDGIHGWEDNLLHKIVVSTLKRG